MKRIVSGMLCGFVVLFGLGVTAQGAPHIYKWVKDRIVNSDRVLPAQQKSRVVPIPEAAALGAVRKVLTDDLFMGLAEYHKTKHIQDAETTADTVLPEEVIGTGDLELVDEDYRFFLEIKFRAYGDRTRITAKCSPMYRIRDTEAEDEAYGDSAAASTSVDIKVNAESGSAVGVGPIFILPIEGLPSEYRCIPLPDAAERAGKIVRSFMYLLDKQVATAKPAAE
jgi:hypothetical protein